MKVLVIRGVCGGGDWPIVFDQENGKYGSGDHQRLNTFSTPKIFIANNEVLPFQYILTNVSVKMLG